MKQKTKYLIIGIVIGIIISILIVSLLMNFRFMHPFGFREFVRPENFTNMTGPPFR